MGYLILIYASLCKTTNPARSLILSCTLYVLDQTAIVLKTLYIITDPGVLKRGGRYMGIIGPTLYRHHIQNVNCP